MQDALASVDNPRGRREIRRVCIEHGTTCADIKNGLMKDQEVLESIWDKIRHIR